MIYIKLGYFIEWNNYEMNDLGLVYKLLVFCIF